MKISNPRDLLLQLLGELLYVERRLAGGVLRDLIAQVRDEQLQELLRDHLEQTREHVERCETAFRRLDAAPSAHQSRAFESAVAEHGEHAASIVTPSLADAFHAQAALGTEHLELALYTAVLAFGDDALAQLQESVRDEEAARDALTATLARLLQADAG